jgi:phage protein D
MAQGGTAVNANLPLRPQIIINNEDVVQKYGMDIAALTVEEAMGASPVFAFTVNENVQLNIINSEIFETGKTVQIKMGYVGEQSHLIGKITAIKTVFSSDTFPQIEVSGEGKNAELKASVSTGNQAITLAYGNNLHSATIEVATETLADKPLQNTIILKNPTAKTNSIICRAQCEGLPQIHPGVKVNLTGLGSKYSKQYVIKKSIHNYSSQLGYRTIFDATTEN